MTHRHDLFYINVKYHDYIPKGIQVTERTQICIKKHQREITQNVLKRGLSFLYMTHCHNLFYISAKYHQNIPNSFQVIERTQNGRVDARLISISPEPFSRGIIMSKQTLPVPTASAEGSCPNVIGISRKP